MSTESVDATTPRGLPMATPTIPMGSHVEVRRRFDRRWARGFLVDAVLDHGYLLRRLSDDSVLPAVFSADDLRPEAGGDRSS